MSQFTEEQIAEFEKVARPLMKWLNENGHPHMQVVITPTNAQVFSSEISFNTEEYLVD